MKRPIIPLPGGLDEGGETTLNALLVYEDIETGLRARDTAEEFMEDTGKSCRLELTLWNTRLFDDYALASLGEEEAIDADIVIVSVHNSLAPRLHSWLHRWMRRRPRENGALIATFDEPADSAARRDRAYLEFAARCAGMDFIFQHGDGENETNESPDLFWVV
jgi:hypothetical protein